MAMAQNSGTIFCNFLAVVQDETSSRQLLHIAMARNITVELLSGKVHTLAVQPEMTIKELKQEVKVGRGGRGAMFPEAPVVCCGYTFAKHAIYIMLCLNNFVKSSEVSKCVWWLTIGSTSLFFSMQQWDDDPH
jgi:hypothetical protein